MRAKHRLCFNDSRMYDEDLAPYYCTLDQSSSAAVCSNAAVLVLLIRSLLTNNGRWAYLMNIFQHVFLPLPDKGSMVSHPLSA